jgi:hypothetical protein
MQVLGNMPVFSPKPLFRKNTAAQQFSVKIDGIAPE